jgi:hypothetical protein
MIAPTNGKYSSDQPRGADGRWIGAFDLFSATRRDNIAARKPSSVTTRPRSIVAMNIETGGDGGKNDTQEEELSERMFGTGPNGQTNHGRTLTPDMPVAAGYGAPASGFSGNLRFQLQSAAGVPPRNDAATIHGIPYSGHALDQMQNRGLFPSITNHAIRSGSKALGDRPNTSIFYDPTNNVTLMRDETDGTVITVIPGGRQKAPK